VDLVRIAQTDDHAGDRWMPQGELQSSRRQLDP
jgi:hypothetical protein